MLGWEDAAAKAEKVLAFETKMAKAFRSNVELRDVPANYNPMTKAQFLKRYSKFDWAAYFSQMGIGEFDKIIVGQPEVLDVVFKLFAKEDIETVKAYMAASKALKESEEMTFSDEEIDKLLPERLRKTSIS
jgi:putative endopeptidase